MSVNKGRLRWHCRRALLELDLVFAKFLEQHFDKLSEEDLTVLESLLAVEDHDLWAMVNGQKEISVEQWKGLVDLLRRC